MLNIFVCVREKFLKCPFSVWCLKMNTRTIIKFLNSFIQFIKIIILSIKWKQLKIEFARKCKWAELSWDGSSLNWCISGIKVVMQGRKEGLSTICNWQRIWFWVGLQYIYMSADIHYTQPRQVISMQAHAPESWSAFQNQNR